MGHFSGVGFAIPMTRVKWIVSELTQRGKVRRAKVGLRVEPLPTNLAFELKLPVRSGAFVTSVTKGLPAEKSRDSNRRYHRGSSWTKDSYRK